MFKQIALAASLSAIAGTATAQSNPTVGGAPMRANLTIAENASNAPNLTTLVSAVQAADLVDTLASAGPFTVFAPTNAAFGAISQASLNALLQNKSQLSQVLTCHVVPTEAFASDIAGMIAADGGMHPVETVGGCTLTAYMEGGQLRLRDENGRVATVTTADVDQSNGVVHVIDTVMIPGGQVAN